MNCSWVCYAGVLLYKETVRKIKLQLRMSFFLSFCLVFLTRPDTATEVACGWAGAVIKKTSSSIWAGALKNAKNDEKANSDQPTDRPSDRPTDRHSGL